MKKKYAPWWVHLLLIPLQLIFDGVVGLMVLVSSDSSFRMVIPTLLLLGIMTSVVVTTAFHKAAASVKSRRSGGETVVSYKTGLSLWQYWLPFLIQSLLYTAIVMAYGSYEINSFYARPDHVGFAIPVMTLCLAIYLLSLDFITFLLCLYRSLASRKAVKNQP